MPTGLTPYGSAMVRRTVLRRSAVWGHTDGSGEEVAAAGGLDVHGLDQRVSHLFALVSEGLAAATSTCLASDREAARVIVANDGEVDSLYETVEQLAHRQLVVQSLTESDLYLLIAVLQ